MRTNGTFKYTVAGELQRDPDTGFCTSGAADEYLPGCECQIDKSIPAKQIVGTDGQIYTYSYDVFIPKHFKNGGDLAVGGKIQITSDETGNVDEFDIQGVDDLNRKYIEVWG